MTKRVQSVYQEVVDLFDRKSNLLAREEYRDLVDELAGFFGVRSTGLKEEEEPE